MGHPYTYETFCQPVYVRRIVRLPTLQGSLDHLFVLIFGMCVPLLHLLDNLCIVLWRWFPLSHLFRTVSTSSGDGFHCLTFFELSEITETTKTTSFCVTLLCVRLVRERKRSLNKDNAITNECYPLISSLISNVSESPLILRFSCNSRSTYARNSISTTLAFIACSY